MKLATLRDGSRDGQLAVVSRDLSQAHFATASARTMQQLLDDWNFISPQLEDLYATLNGGKARHAFAFDARQCMAPLPRAHGWLRDGAVLGASDALHGAFEAAPQGAADAPPLRLLAMPTLAAITGDVAHGAAPAAALDGVRLLMLAATWQLLDAEGAPLPSGLQPAAHCAPLAITPDELGAAWQRGRAHLALVCAAPGPEATRVDAATALPLHMGELVAQAAAWRRVRAGSVFAAVAATAAVEIAPGTGLHLDALDDAGHSVFGPIDTRDTRDTSDTRA